MRVVTGQIRNVDQRDTSRPSDVGDVLIGEVEEAAIGGADPRPGVSVKNVAAKDKLPRASVVR
jgi:hypothetical protein